MNTEKGALSPAKGRLLKLMEDIGFGTIANLVVNQGEPIFEPPPKIITLIKFGIKHNREPINKTSIREEFLAHLDNLKNGMIHSLEIKKGLPFSMKLEKTVEP